MSTPTSTNTVPKLAANELPAQNVAEIAADMQQTLDVMLQWLKSEPSPVMYFEGKWVVSGEGAIAAIQHFSKDIANRCLTRRGLLKPAAAASKTIKPDGKAIAPAAKPAAKPAATTATTVAAKPAAKRKTSTIKKITPTPAD